LGILQYFPIYLKILPIGTLPLFIILSFFIIYKNVSRGGSRGGVSRWRGSSRGRGTSGNGHTVRTRNVNITPLAQDISQEDEECIILAKE
jgi:hypothetical protein